MSERFKVSSVGDNNSNGSHKNYGSTENEELIDGKTIIMLKSEDSISPSGGPLPQILPPAPNADLSPSANNEITCIDASNLGIVNGIFLFTNIFLYLINKCTIICLLNARILFFSIIY